MVNLELYHFISQMTDCEISELDDTLRLEEDLGLYGDEAVDFMQKYAEKFNVDISLFPFYEYFSPEMDKISSFLKKMVIGLKKNKTLTISDLKKGIIEKKLT